MRASWAGVRALLVVPNRSDAPVTNVPVRFSVPPVQSMALLFAKDRAAPVPRFMFAAPVMSSVPRLSV